MLKKTIALILCIGLMSSVAYADSEKTTFSGTVKGESIEVTVAAAEGVNVRAFVYTTSVSGAGHSMIHEVTKIDIPSGEEKEIIITPPGDGYSKKLVVAERMTLLPLCKSYEYPYIMNVFAEPLGYTLLNVGSVTHGGKDYASNTFEINASEFDYAEDEPSMLSLQLAANAGI